MLNSRTMDDASSPSQARGFRLFAGFFKSYMGVMPIVTAAFAPVLTLLRAFPMFDSQRGEIASYLGLLSFLILAWVYFSRDALDSFYVVKGLMSFLVLCLIAGSVVSFVLYNDVLNRAIQVIQFPSSASSKPSTLSVADILKSTPSNGIPNNVALIVYYT